MTAGSGAATEVVPVQSAPVGRYLTATAVTVLAVLSQYFLPPLVPGVLPAYHSFAGGLLIVYAIPVVAFALLVGGAPLRRWRVYPVRAAWEGVRWSGSLMAVGLLVTGILLAIYSILDPSALKLLSKQNPVLTNAAGDPYFWIAFSFVIGAVEETIFRGWVFGYWVARGSPRLGFHAAWTSVLFAGVHLYYGTTYGIAAPIQVTTLFLLGFAYAQTVRATGGNLVMVALLHGVNDASAFSTLLSPDFAVVYLFGMIVVGLVIGLLHFVRGPPWQRKRPWGVPAGATAVPPTGAPPLEPWGGPPPPPPPPFSGA